MGREPTEKTEKDREAIEGNWAILHLFHAVPSPSTLEEAENTRSKGERGFH